MFDAGRQIMYNRKITWIQTPISADNNRKKKKELQMKKAIIIGAGPAGVKYWSLRKARR